MECNDIKDKLSAHIDRELSREEKARVDEHLKHCPRCRSMHEELKQTVTRIKDLEEAEPPAWLEHKIMAKVRAEAEQKKGFLQSLLYPLHVKVPLQAAATVALCIVAFLLFKKIEPEMKHPALAPETSDVLNDKGDEKPADSASEQYAVPRSSEPGRAATADKPTVPKAIPDTELLMNKAKTGAPMSEMSEKAPPSLYGYAKKRDRYDAPGIKITLFYVEDQAEMKQQDDSSLHEIAPGVMFKSESERVVTPKATFTGILRPQLMRTLDGTGYVYSVMIRIDDSEYYLADRVHEEVRNELREELDSFLETLHEWTHILSDEEVNTLRQERMLTIGVKEPRQILRRFHSEDVTITVIWNEEWN